MSSNCVKIDADIYSQLQKILGALTAFGVAMVLLFIQGSIAVDSPYDAMAVLAIIASIPLTTASYLLVYKAAQLGMIRRAGDRIIDWLAVSGIGLNVGGFLGLLIGTNRLFAFVFIGAFVVGVIAFTLCMKYLRVDPGELAGSIKESELSKKDQACSSQ